MNNNVIKKTINKIRNLNLATIGIIAFLFMVLLLTVSLSMGIESNYHLWIAILLMLIGVVTIIMQQKKL